MYCDACGRYLGVQIAYNELDSSTGYYYNVYWCEHCNAPSVDFDHRLIYDEVHGELRPVAPTASRAQLRLPLMELSHD